MTTETNPSNTVSSGQVISGLIQSGRLPINEIPSSSEQPLQCDTQPPDQTPGTDWRHNLFQLDESHHESVQSLLLAGEWYVREMRKSSGPARRLVISGSTGCGKSHLARRITRYAESYGTSILFRRRLAHWSCSWVDWVPLAEADDEQHFLDNLWEIERASFVVIDDVGSEVDRFKNGSPNSRLRRVLEAVRSKWVIATTNLDRKTVESQYDNRVVDRLDAYNWVELGEVPSYRPKLRAQ